MTKLVLEHGLEVDDCTRVHLAADPLSVTDVTMGVGVTREPNNVDITVCFID